MIQRIANGVDARYHARMSRRAQHLRCSLCERSERADNRLDKDARRQSELPGSSWYGSSCLRQARSRKANRSEKGEATKEARFT